MADPAWKRMGYQSEAEYKAYREVHDAMVKAGTSRPVPEVLMRGADVPASVLKRILAEQPLPPASSTPAIPVGASDRRGVEAQLDEQLVKTLESQPASEVEEIAKANATAARARDLEGSPQAFWTFPTSPAIPEDKIRKEAETQPWISPDVAVAWTKLAAQPKEENPYITALRPQVLASPEETADLALRRAGKLPEDLEVQIRQEALAQPWASPDAAVTEAVSERSVNPLLGVLSDVMSLTDKRGRTVESPLSWLGRVLSAPPSLVVGTLEAGVGSWDFNSKIPERIAEGGGFAQGTQDIVTAFRQVTGVDERTRSERDMEGTSLDEKAGFLLGLVGDLLVPLDFGIAEGLRGASLGASAALATGQGVARATVEGAGGMLPRFLGRASDVRESVAARVAANPDNRKAAEAWASAADEAAVPDEAVRLGLPKTNEARQAALARAASLSPNDPIDAALRLAARERMAAYMTRESTRGLTPLINPRNIPARAVETIRGAGLRGRNVTSRVGDYVVPASAAQEAGETVSKQPALLATRAAVDSKASSLPADLAPYMDDLSTRAGASQTETDLVYTYFKRGLKDPVWYNRAVEKVLELEARAARPGAAISVVGKVPRIVEDLMRPEKLRTTIMAARWSDDAMPAVKEGTDEISRMLSSASEEVMADIRQARRTSPTVTKSFNKVVEASLKEDDAVPRILARIFGGTAKEVDEATELLIEQARLAGTPMNELAKLIAASDSPTDTLIKLMRASRGRSLGDFLDTNASMTSRAALRVSDAAAENPVSVLARHLIQEKQAKILKDEFAVNTLASKVLGVDEESWFAAKDLAMAYQDLIKGVQLTSDQKKLVRKFAKQMFVNRAVGFNSPVAVKELVGVGIPVSRIRRYRESVEAVVKQADKLERKAAERFTPAEVAKLVAAWEDLRGAIRTNPTGKLVAEGQIASTLSPLDAEKIKDVFAALEVKSSKWDDTFEAMGGSDALMVPAQDAVRIMSGMTPKQMMDAISKMDTASTQYVAKNLVSFLAINKDSAFNAYKKIRGLAINGMLGGYFVPNMGFHMANVLTAPLIAYQVFGGKASMRATASMAGLGEFMAEESRHLRKMVTSNAVTRFLYGTNSMTPRWLVDTSAEALGDTPAVRVADGRTYTVKQLAEMAARNGVLSSQINKEVTTSILTDVVRWSGRTSAGLGVGQLRGVLRRNMDPASMSFWSAFGQTMDTRFRVSVMADALIAGKTEAEATLMAREALFNYNSLTDFERATAVKFIWFYRFLRSSAVRTADAVTTNPQRVRNLIYASQYGKNGKPQPIVDEEGNLVAAKDYDIIQSGLSQSKPLLALVSSEELQRRYGIYGPPVPMADSILLLAGYLNIADTFGRDGFVAGSEELGADVVGRSGPFVGGAMAVVTGIRPSFGEFRKDTNKVDPRYVTMLKLTGQWEWAKRFFKIVEESTENAKRTGETGFASEFKSQDPNVPTRTIVYRILPDTNGLNVRAWQALLDLSLAVGVQRASRDYAMMFRAQEGIVPGPELGAGVPTGSYLIDALDFAGVVTGSPLQTYRELESRQLSSTVQELRGQSIKDQ